MVEFLYHAHYYTATKQGYALCVAAMRCALATDIGVVTVHASSLLPYRCGTFQTQYV